MTALLAFVWGLIAIGGIVNCDVSHLRRQNHYSQQSGQTFVANNGQYVRQSYNSNGNPTFSSSTYKQASNSGNNIDQNKNYWWLRNTRNTDVEQPKTYNTNHQQQKTSVSNYFSAGCNGCSSQKLNLNRHNTQKHNNNNNYRQQQNTYNTNVKQNSFQTSQNSIHHHRQSTSVSGSPVNNFQNFNSGRIQQQQTSNCDSNSACVAPKFCNSGFIDSSAEAKAVRSSSGRCYAPEVCCRFSSNRRNAQYQDNSVSEARGTSEVLTKEGYVVNKPSNQYLPSYNDAPSNVNPTRVPGPTPSRQPQQPPRQTPPPYQPQPTNNRPVVQYDPAPVIIPLGCSAAMNCTNVQYCTASGVISKTPVTLSPQQEMFRVPLTDCRNPDTKEVGKCCRDPDYVDPWPVGRTGQYVAEELNAAFDSGAYKPEPSKNVPVRVRAKEEGYVVPQPSATQQRLYLPPNRI